MRLRRPLRVRPGFTIIEVLVVISIITLLTTILLPVLSTVRQQARDATCLSNLHQLGSAMQVYASDSNYWPAPADTSKPKWWSLNYLYRVVYGKPPAPATLSGNSWLRGTIFECPAAAQYDIPSGFDYLWNSYGMSARLNDQVTDTGDYRGDFKHPNLVKTPSDTTLLIDCTQQWSGTIVTATPAPSNSQLQAVQNAVVRHNNHRNYLNVLFCDYHAATMTYDSIPTVHASAAWQEFWAGI